MRRLRGWAALSAALLTFACSPAPPKTPEVATPAPFVLPGTQVLPLRSAKLGRDYRLFVYLPDSYAKGGGPYPVLFVTDAEYAFPLIRSIARRVGDRGRGLEDFILVGLSYADGEESLVSRNRDYTPTPNGGEDDEAGGRDSKGRPFVYGQAEAYRAFVAEEVFPLVARTYRADMSRKIYAGHSYGGLFGAHVLLTDPGMFEGYILSSPSLWYDRRTIFETEARYAAAHRDLPARVFLAIGGYETVNAAARDLRYNKRNDMVGAMRDFETRLRTRRYPGLSLTSEVLAGEDHLTVFPASITHGLIWAFGVRK